MNYIGTFFIILALLVVLLGLMKNNNIENFKSATSLEVEGGSSTFYDWGKEKEKSCIIETDSCHEKKEPLCKNCTSGDNVIVNNDYYIYGNDNKNKESCNKCDITRHPDIDKYVIKSSVPPCPDMADYALKSQMEACPDLSNYIKKSEIPPCPKCPDLRKYVLKSSIPAQVPCPVCPVCPICPPSINNDFLKSYNDGYNDAKNNRKHKYSNNDNGNMNSNGNMYLNGNMNTNGNNKDIWYINANNKDDTC